MVMRRLRAPLALAALISILATSTTWANGPSEMVLPVPHRTQSDGSIWASSNCGPAAIAMVLESFGLNVSTSKLRNRANQLLGIADPNSGTRVQDLARIVQEHGLSVKRPFEGGRVKRWTLEEVRTELQFGRPMVIQVYYPLLPNHRKNPIATDHYIVLVGLSGDEFIFNDSADRDSPGFQQKITAEELTNAWKASQFPFAGFSVGSGGQGQPLLPPAPEARDAGASIPSQNMTPQAQDEPTQEPKLPPSSTREWHLS
jgi:hypothetical protein